MTTLRSGGPVALLALLSACGPATPPTTDDTARGDDDSAGLDSATDDTDETSLPGDSDSDAGSDSDTDPPGHTDTAGHSDTDTVDTVDTGPLDVPALSGGFVDLTAGFWAARSWVVPPEDDGFEAIPTVAWGDLDGDGQGELLVGGVRERADALRERLLLRPDGQGGWTVDPTWSDWIAARTFHDVLAVEDVDGDGVDDLVFGSVEEDGLWLGRKPAPTRATLDVDPSPPGGSTVLALVDLDADGWLDLLHAPYTCGTTDIVLLPFLRTGLRRWTARADLVERGLAAHAYAVLPVPRPDGSLRLAMLGAACKGAGPHPGFYDPVALGADGLPRWAPLDPVPPDAGFRLRPAYVGAAFTVLRPMGGAFVDLDGDGAGELVVAPAIDQLQILSSPWDAPMRDRTARLDALLPLGAAGRPMLAWGVVPVDLEADGWPDLAVGLGDDAREFLGEPPNGPYWVDLQWNAGGRGFVDVSTAVGLQQLQGHAQQLFGVDVDGDLDLDLLSAGQGRPPRLLRNDVVAHGGRLGLRLRGTTSNHLGVGAVVTAEVPGLPRQTVVVGASASPGGVSSPEVRLATGSALAVTVVVTWPSGTVQRLEGLAPGVEHVVTEPVTLALSEEDRHLSADGAATVVVQLTPRRPDGTADPTASVTLELTHGEGTWLGPATWTGAAWERTLQAPAAAGSARVEATVDGVPVQVRPRVWWDAASP
ncbi:MAG: ASPIC/UnbV domain-containing protein [Alphaproteobacteria bacterium]|nr:ASPIC/UnbV domain-containing protein [Alphaproteobacteria bacterium]